jgi:tetratricopeptide (TPR) repeat protein
MNIYDEAVSFLKEGYYSKAVELLKKVTQARPGWAKGFIYLGRAYDGQKWHKAAVMTFQRALEIEPANGEVLGLMDLSRKKLRVQELYAAGKALEKNGKYLDAAEKYRSALALEEEYKKIAETAGSDYLGEANKLFNLGRLEETVNLSDKAIKVNPDDVDAHYLKGRALMGLGKIAEAVLEFKKVVELDPKKDVGLDELMMQ